MTSTLNGFYAAYLSGAAGQGFSLLIFRNGRIIGSDAVGAKYEGNYSADVGNSYLVKLKITLPANMPLIQGGTTGPEGDAHDLTFQMPSDFLLKDFIRIEGKYGPVNAKLVKLGELDD